jgi:hypothetical protein
MDMLIKNVYWFDQFTVLKLYHLYYSCYRAYS